MSNITEKLQIRKGSAYSTKHAGDIMILHIVDIVVAKIPGESRIKFHNDEWLTAADFAKREPIEIGRSRKFLGFIIGIKRN